MQMTVADWCGPLHSDLTASWTEAIATVVAALVSIAAVIFVIRTWRDTQAQLTTTRAQLTLSQQEIRLVEEQTKLSDLQARLAEEQVRADARERRRTQARLVSCQVKNAHPNSDTNDEVWPMVVVRNDSPEPLLQVVPFLVANDRVTQVGGMAVLDGNGAEYDAEAPGRLDALFGRGHRWNFGRAGCLFRDANGVLWSRMPSGELLEGDHLSTYEQNLRRAKASAAGSDQSSGARAELSGT